MILTKENAKNVASIRAVDNPEWGTKRFNYQSDFGAYGERFSSAGSGCNSFLLYDHEFHFWEVVSLKDGTKIIDNLKAKARMA